jgi:L-serine dehydratase
MSSGRGDDGRVCSARSGTGLAPLSVFDLLTVGLGPSSSHTVGPMHAARLFAEALADSATLGSAKRLRVDLYGSLGATGLGHGSVAAVMLGLEGLRPELVDPATIPERLQRIDRDGSLCVLGEWPVLFSPSRDLLMHLEPSRSGHPNAMRFEAFDAEGVVLERRSFDSIGGGAVSEDACGPARARAATRAVPPHPFCSGRELLDLCREHHLSVSQLALRNELSWRTEAGVRSGLLSLWGVMEDCIRRGCETEGSLPGDLRLQRRAPQLRGKVLGDTSEPSAGFFGEIDRVSLDAIAVAEENAAGGRVVTAPTNGSAGIIPAVLHYALRSIGDAGEDLVVDFLLAAGAIGSLYKQNASISGAEVGCQGEVGVACSMAAAGLAQVLGATPEQVEAAAEIGMEHNLGLTCDPIAGLVQVPCIERNALGAVMAIAAARLALQESGEHLVSLDSVIETMRETGRDMHDNYKETARGGLATAVSCVSVCTVEC